MVAHRFFLGERVSLTLRQLVVGEGGDKRGEVCFVAVLELADKNGLIGNIAVGVADGAGKAIEICDLGQSIPNGGRGIIAVRVSLHGRLQQVGLIVQACVAKLAFFVET